MPAQHGQEYIAKHISEDNIYQTKYPKQVAAGVLALKGGGNHIQAKIP